MRKVQVYARRLILSMRGLLMKGNFHLPLEGLFSRREAVFWNFTVLSDIKVSQETSGLNSLNVTLNLGLGALLERT